MLKKNLQLIQEYLCTTSQRRRILVPRNKLRFGTGCPAMLQQQSFTFGWRLEASIFYQKRSPPSLACAYVHAACRIHRWIARACVCEYDPKHCARVDPGISRTWGAQETSGACKTPPRMDPLRRGEPKGLTFSFLQGISRVFSSDYSAELSVSGSLFEHD